MTKNLILPNFSGWYYFSTHRGTKYHFFYKLSYHAVCGSMIFNDRKNDKHLHRKIDNLAQWRVCQHCLNKLELNKALVQSGNLQQPLTAYEKKLLRSRYSRSRYTWHEVGLQA